MCILRENYNYLLQLSTVRLEATIARAWRPAATCRAWMRNRRNIVMQIPYAVSTPTASEARTAEIKTIEFTATPQAL